MKKRGQFFLAAAFVIVAILAGIGTLTNYVKTSQNDQLTSYLAHSVKHECLKRIDYLMRYEANTQSGGQTSYSHGAEGAKLSDNVRSIIVNYSKTYSNYKFIVVFLAYDGVQSIELISDGNVISSWPADEFFSKPTYDSANHKFVVKTKDNVEYYSLPAYANINNLYLIIEKSGEAYEERVIEVA